MLQKLMAMKSLTQFLTNFHTEVLIMGLSNDLTQLSCLFSFFSSKKYFLSSSLSFIKMHFSQLM